MGQFLNSIKETEKDLLNNKVATKKTEKQLLNNKTEQDEFKKSFEIENYNENPNDKLLVECKILIPNKFLKFRKSFKMTKIYKKLGDSCLYSSDFIGKSGSTLFFTSNFEFAIKTVRKT